MPSDELKVLTDAQIETLVLGAVADGSATEEQLRAWIAWCHDTIADAMLVQNVLKGRMTVRLSDGGPDTWTYRSKE